MTDTLYIIGNGFDLHHGLQTTYKDFRENYARKHAIVVWRKLQELYGDKINDNIWWSQFENMLGFVDYVSLLNSPNGGTLGFIKVQQFLKNTLPPLFGVWIKGVDSEIVPCSIDKIPDIDETSLFLSFNYTSVLERVYKVPKENIWYIHNSIGDYIKQGINPIVGHDINQKTLMDYSSLYIQQGVPANIVDSINREIQNGAKMVHNRIRANDEKFSKYAAINQIVAMGFSFNDIDMPYIEKIMSINCSISNVRWTIYWHGGNENKIIKEKLLKLRVPEDNIDMIYW